MQAILKRTVNKQVTEELKLTLAPVGDGATVRVLCDIDGKSHVLGEITSRNGIHWIPSGPLPPEHFRVNKDGYLTVVRRRNQLK